MSDVGISAVMQGMSVAEKVTGNVGMNMANADTPGFNGIVSQVYSNVVGVGEKDKMDLNPGPIESTGREFDYGLNGRGFFAVDCNNARRYTHSGSFTTDKDGYLVTPANCKLLGEKYADGATKPIENLEGDLEPVRISSVGYDDAIASTKVDVNYLKLSATQMAVGGGKTDITLSAVNGKSFTLEFVFMDDQNNEPKKQTYKFTKDSADHFDPTKEEVKYTNEIKLADTINSNTEIRKFFKSATAGSSGVLKLDFNNDVRMKFDKGDSSAKATNLNGKTDASDGPGFVDSYDPFDANNNMSGKGEKPDYSKPFPIIDSKGIKHNAEMLFKKTSDDHYVVEIKANPQELRSGGAYTRTDGLIAAGKMKFDGKKFSGFEEVSSTLKDGAADLKDGPPTFRWDKDLNYGATNTISFDFTKSYMSGKEYAIDISEDGQTEASFVNTSIDKNGNLMGHYSNGKTQYLYAVPLAMFKDAAAVEREYGTVVMETAESGEASYEIAGKEGAGTVTGKSLNASNVNITKEMTRLIETQRFYSFNAKAYGHMLRMENVLLDVV